MKIESLKAEDIGLPIFPIREEDLNPTCDQNVSSFDLSSHSRAREAIFFGLKMRSQGRHVFVVGGDRSGRMTTTLEHLKTYVKQLPPPPDWVYLNNFTSPYRPLPYRLPTGMGCRLRAAMGHLVRSIQEVCQKTFNSPAFMSLVNSLSMGLQDEVNEKVQELQKFAHTKGVHIQEENEQFTIVTMDDHESTNGALGKFENKPLPYTMQDIHEIRQKLALITSDAHLRSIELNREVRDKRRQEAEIMIQPLMRLFVEEFSPYIKDWIDDLHTDILDHIDNFLDEESESEEEGKESDFFNRYAVNVIIDNRHAHHPAVIVEPSPSYENIFGSIKYKSQSGGFGTDFTLIRGGSLHRANGGILIIRADAIAANIEMWNALKAAMRDRIIRIEERHRENSIPMLDAPEPKGIPLDVQIFIVGAPVWFYAFFYNDQDFKTYFKVKAEIEPSFPATPENISIYTKLIAKFAHENEKKKIDAGAVQYLIGYSARWMNSRDRLSSQFEMVADILTEANILSNEEKSSVINGEHVRKVFLNRRNRNASLEDRTHQDFENGLILIDVTGKSIGQINGLSVLNHDGDHQFGIPNRITARTFVGDEGVVNIERLTDLGGPIQQKGAFILDGYLNGLFAQKHPLSCTCSLTFEQSYGEIEGDSASLAELLAILSSLSGVPLRQDIAVTGSVNQFGMVQAVGGVHHKIEGFFRVCQKRGLTGTQGVIVPQSNHQNVIVYDEIVDAIRAKKFSIWPVSTVQEALFLLTGVDAGQITAAGKFPKDSIFEKVSKKLDQYWDVLNENKS